MTTNKTLNLIASKLDVGDDEKVLRKAAEFERLLQTKSTAGSNMTDTCKIVICLNLAANMLGNGLDIKSAIKYSGLKPLAYSNLRKVVENLLELNSNQITIPILCASLQCDGVQQLADRVLEEYQKHAKVKIDLNLPQYVCMAVYQACRINKVKISKAKILEKCNLKPAQWSKLDAEWTKFVDQQFTVAKTKRGRPTKKTVIEEDKEDKIENDYIKSEVDSEPQIEIYEDWKRRILQAAYKELEEQQKREKDERIRDEEQQKKETANEKERVKAMTPRRSPRKTPQKFSPYKIVIQSPSKNKGVRLLFPVES